MKKIPLRRLVNRKRTVVAHAIVDDEDYEWLSKMRWHLTPLGYAMTNVPHGSGYRREFMHRMVNDTPKHLQTDHINRDCLDNRRSNLRSVESWQNVWNRAHHKKNKSGRTGVYKDKKTGRWCALIQVHKRVLHLGMFATVDAAGDAYDSALKLHRTGSTGT